MCKEVREKRNHTSTLTTYAMVAEERAIAFLIAHQRLATGKAAIVAAKQAAWAAKKGVVATNVEAKIPEKKEEVDDGTPTYEELKEICGYASVSVENYDNNNTTSYGLCEIGINNDQNGKGDNSTMTGVGNSESGPNITVLSKPGPVVTDSKTAGVSFADIVRGNIVPTLSASGHPGDGQSSRPHCAPTSSKRYMLEPWKLYLDSCATYHTAFVTSMLDYVGEYVTTLVGKYNAGVTSSTQKGYYGKFHMWINKNGMASLLSIPCLEQEGHHIKYNSDDDWVVKTL